MTGASIINRSDGSVATAAADSFSSRNSSLYYKAHSGKIPGLHNLLFALRNS